VLLDFVPNHWSHQHFTFQDALKNADSPYVGWYHFKSRPDAYETFFGVKELPQINLRNPAARRHMLDAARYWLEFGVDGYRLDYAIGPAPDFWADFRQVTRQVRPDCWTFGEVVEPSGTQIGFHGLLDGCLDFLLLEALRQTFAFRRWNLAQLADFLDRHEAYFPRDFSRPSFLDNHDMNRYLWAAQGDQRSLRLAALCQFTLTSPPIIYYGTEVGLSQVRDVRQGEFGRPEESRLPMLWGDAQDAELLAYYRSLAAVRRAEICLRRGDRQAILVNRDYLAYIRRYEDQSLAVVFSIAQTPVTLSIPGRWKKILLSSDAGCHLTSGEDSAEISLPAVSAVIVK